MSDKKPRYLAGNPQKFAEKTRKSRSNGLNSVPDMV